jgi:hypothetical protein
VAASADGPVLAYEHRPGGAPAAVYRLEARLDAANAAWRVPWIVSNPIRIVASAAPVRVAPAPPAAEAVQPIPESLATNPWLLERDEESRASLDPRPQRGVRLAYALAGGAPRGQYAGAALTFVPGTFIGWDRIRFRGRASREMRVSVQVREPQGRRWIRSVVLFTDPRDIVVRFDEMRVPEPVLAGRPPRPELASLLFVVDTTNTATGSSGTVDIEDVRLEREAR